jgi:hypothetical protein
LDAEYQKIQLFKTIKNVQWWRKEGRSKRHENYFPWVLYSFLPQPAENGGQVIPHVYAASQLDQNSALSASAPAAWMLLESLSGKKIVKPFDIRVEALRTYAQ